MSFDPFLYVALVAGLIAGRLTTWRSPWVGRATLATIVLLVFTLGASLGSLTGWNSLLTVAYSVGLALAILAATAVFSLLLPRPPLPPTGTAAPARPPIPLGPILLLDLVVGYAFGHFVSIPPSSVLTGALYVLVALVAFDLRLSMRSMRYVALPVLAAVAGAVLVALVIGFATPVGLQASFAITFGFGWYTLAGPLVTARLGATLGLLAFLTNFLRENLTMVLSPSIGPKLRGEGLTALGGATSMDTTLYFVTRYGDPEAGSLALTSGLILTLAASLLLPLILGFG